MKTSIFFILSIVLLMTNLTYAQQDTSLSFGDEGSEIDYFFGFNLIPNAMGGLFHVALIKPEKNNTYKVKQLTLESFMAQAKGKEQSLANPKGIDFFKKFEIENPNIIYEVWRLRYMEYPYKAEGKIDPGWSTNDSIPYIPSKTQMKTLEKFGMFRLNDYIYGDNFFRLLQMMAKPEWVKLYKESF
jgi:hypothetical protein